jgi:hypothetical protein
MSRAARGVREEAQVAESCADVRYGQVLYTSVLDSLTRKP